jgi:aryl-alcohol dehydrogenase-like predicted oxidoreductase/adenylate kinase family enzyme
MPHQAWLEPSELRIGLGCMRLPADEQLALETVVAAAHAGMTVFDTARAYGADIAGAGHNERLVAGALRAAGRQDDARIVTKGGMTRPGGAWVPDGRAKSIAADCEASLEALDGLPIDLYLLHAPDPRTPWPTSVRALARLVEQGLVRRVGLANVTRAQLDQALELAPIAAVQVGLSLIDDRAVRGGVVARCDELGLALIAHSPLGGPRRKGALARSHELTQVGARHGATAAEAALAWLLDLSRNLVAIPGARRPDSARSAAGAAALALDDDDRATIAAALGTAARPAALNMNAARCGTGDEVVIVMGIPGAGKSRLAADFVRRGYVRLNRDERGGSLRMLVDELDAQLAAGVGRVVLDNTYLTRAARSHVVEAAARHSLPVRCLWLETSLAQAQVNLVQRLLERFGSLPMPEQIREASRREPWLMLPTSQMRALRELEPPSSDEGFAEVETVPFARASPDGAGAAVFVGASAAQHTGIAEALADAAPSAPHLIFDWLPEGDAGALRAEVDRVAGAVTGPVEVAVCPHGAGPPRCWCRPPLPGLPLAFARAHGADPARAILIGCSPAHRTLASTLGARYLVV